MRRISCVLKWTCLMLLTLACHKSHRVTRTNLAYIYFDDPTIIHPEYQIFHKRDSLTEFYAKIRSSEVLYSKNNPDKAFLSKVVLNLCAYNSQNDKKVITCDTVFLFDRGGAEFEKYLVGQGVLKLSNGSNYLVEVTLDDQYRMQFVQNILFVRKEDPSSSQYFLLKNKENEIQFGYVHPLGIKLYVESGRSLKGPLTVKFFDREGKLPSPPFIEEGFSETGFIADSTFETGITTDRTFEFKFDRKGIYQFLPDESDHRGLAIVVDDAYFPEVKSVNSMLRAMRYVTTNQEYKDLSSSSNIKKSVDDFWFNVAGNTEKARDLIKTYYGRVEISNMNFSSDRAGWKTDRGLIYIIYGPPNSVIRTLDYEFWTYSEKNNMMSVEFTFYKMENPFTDNDYFLNRSVSYKSSWYRAIDNWRQGRIF